MTTNQASPLTRKDIAAGLRRLGIGAGDGVMVHSSLKSFGPVESGPLTIIEALMDVLTPEGTLLMPTFNHGKPWESGGCGFYDPATIPTINGIIPETFRRLPDVHRSLDPTHAVAAWGKNALRYTQFHHRTLTMGPDSPLGLLGREGGCAVMLGVGYGTNTYHHVVEMTLGVPCLGKRTEAYEVRLPGGRSVIGRTWGWRGGSCPVCDGAQYGERMKAVSKTTAIGSCNAIIFKLSDAFRVISAALAQGLNGSPPCSRCPIRPRVVPQTVESDWDDEKQCLKDDSQAWMY